MNIIEKTQAPQEQINYANILFYGCWSGLALMVLVYCLYVFGILEPFIPIKNISSYWVLPVHEYLTQNQIPTGWGWLDLVGKGDFLNFVGIAFLAGLTIVCYFTGFLAYLKKKDTLFAIIAGLEILVLCFAASGIVGAGH